MAPQVTQPPGQVIKPGSWKSVADEGMPVHGRPYEKGNLYIHFNVKFPDQLSQQQVCGIRQLLQQQGASQENGTMDVDAEQVFCCAS